MCARILNGKRRPNTQQERDEEVGLLAVLDNFSISNKPDSWVLLSNDKMEDFTVRKVRKDLEKSMQVSVQQDEFKWSSTAIPKVNHFVWRAKDGQIPTASALVGRNVSVGDDKCLLCGIYDEDKDHLLVACSFAKSVWWNICVWLKMVIPTSFDLVKQILCQVQNSGMATKRKKVVYSIFLLTLWQI
ncbi:putative reverse transcriptase zinc-binding domain-containing protein [Helianthus annuus]|nr:putative reverse transcriptase zinc-binding domain-containing protein [Helianthus annuus]